MVRSERFASRRGPARLAPTSAVEGAGGRPGEEDAHGFERELEDG